MIRRMIRHLMQAGLCQFNDGYRKEQMAMLKVV